MTKDIRKGIGIFAKILSETPAQRQQRLLGIYRECGGKAQVPVRDVNPGIEKLQVYWSGKVPEGLR